MNHVVQLAVWTAERVIQVALLYVRPGLGVEVAVLKVVIDPDTILEPTVQIVV
jgi:hypothetical protein